jgi:hypothetical protein
MNKKEYQLAVVLTINTFSYEDALDWAAEIVRQRQKIEDRINSGVKVELITDYAIDQGQRVIHLDPVDEEVEPPEPDGEDFRGTEYESYMAEQQAKIQRELK